MYGLIGKMLAQPGQRQALAAIMLANTQGMPGCLSYVVANDPTDDNAIWITEVWTDQASHRASLQLPQVQELDIPVEKRLTLLQLNEHTCKWPIGDPLTPDFYFCGQHSEEGKPYCDFHSRRAYHQIEKKKR